MNKLICVVLSALILFAGCTSDTDYGDCIGCPVGPKKQAERI